MGHGAGRRRTGGDDLVVGLGRRTRTETATGWGSGAVAASATPTEPAQQQATPAVPAGWYHDPAGRFELRYWDGSAWTEHVSRAGQQYTDPPVA